MDYEEKYNELVDFLYDTIIEAVESGKYSLELAVIEKYLLDTGGLCKSDVYKKDNN